MYINDPAGKTSHNARARLISDATRRARALRLAADALDTAGRWDPTRELTGPDVARLLGHPMATGYHYDAAKAINETCSGRRFGPTVPPTINIELAVQILRDDAIVRPVRQLGDGGAR